MVGETEIVVTRKTFLVGLIIAILASSAISTAISTQLLRGPQGPKGDKGDTGLEGLTGTDGLDGMDGVNGTDGLDGKSAYHIWLDQGNSGTEQDFLDSLKGEQGPPGPPGICLGGFISVPAAAFIEEDRGGRNVVVNISDMWGGAAVTMWAPVQLPHNATIVKMTGYLIDRSVEVRAVLELWGFNLTANASFGPMAKVETNMSIISLFPIVLHDDSINYSKIDNEHCIYALKLYTSAASMDFASVKGVIIEYKHQALEP